MTFSSTITDFWHAPFANRDTLSVSEAFSIVVNPDLSEERRIMVLETAEGKVQAVVTPAIAEQLDIRQSETLSEPDFRDRVTAAGLTLHGADYLFYFTEAEKSIIRSEHIGGDVRQLSELDSAAFAEFESSASEQDRDDAYVELDHWAVCGSFESELLVSAASMYPWEDAQLADLGVLTLVPFRGIGHARKVVRSLSRYALQQGYETQYRCQFDNAASVSLANSAGLTLFGKWEVISPDSED